MEPAPCCCDLIPSNHHHLPMQYRNPWDEVRLGRLLEDLDSLAGFIAFNHW